MPDKQLELPFPETLYDILLPLLRMLNTLAGEDFEYHTPTAVIRPNSVYYQLCSDLGVEYGTPEEITLKLANLATL